MRIESTTLGRVVGVAAAATLLFACAKKSDDGAEQAAADAAPAAEAAAPAAPTAAEALAGIQATFDKAHELFARGAPATEIAEALYEDDLTITGEGENGLYPNLQSFMEPLQAYTRNPTCRLSVVDDIRHSGDLAAAWVAEHCDAHGEEKAEDFRMIYVFRNGPKGWRVTMELFAVGKF